MYPEYKFQVIPLVIAAMGYTPKCWISYLKMIGFHENESEVLILDIRSINI